MQLKKIELLANKYASINPFNNVYGIARTLLAFGTLSTLLFHDINVLLRPAGLDKVSPFPEYVDIGKLSIFYILSSDYFNIAKWLCIIILVLVISGWRPRITGILTLVGIFQFYGIMYYC